MPSQKTSLFDSLRPPEICRCSGLMMLRNFSRPCSLVRTPRNLLNKAAAYLAAASRGNFRVVIVSRLARNYSGGKFSTEGYRTNNGARQSPAGVSVRSDRGFQEFDVPLRDLEVSFSSDGALRLPAKSNGATVSISLYRLLHRTVRHTRPKPGYLTFLPIWLW